MPVRLTFKRAGVRSDRFKEGSVAQRDLASIHLPGYALAGYRGEIGTFRQHDAPVVRTFDDRRCQRMLAATLKRSGQAENFTLVEAICRLDFHQLRLCCSCHPGRRTPESFSICDEQYSKTVRLWQYCWELLIG